MITGINPTKICFFKGSVTYKMNWKVTIYITNHYIEISFFITFIGNPNSIFIFIES